MPHQNKLRPTVSPGIVFARRLAAERERQKLTQQQLADRTEALGAPISRVTIAKIESAGKRGGGQRAANVSLEDVLILSAALHTSPAVLFLPIGEVDDVAITPTEIVHPHHAMQWIEGIEPLMNRHIREWRRSVLPLRMYQGLRSLRAVEEEARRELKRAKDSGLERRLEKATVAHEEALTALHEYMQRMEDRGVRPVELSPEVNGAMRAIGFEPWTEEQ